MTTISFSKYQGAGNDFIMIDDRRGDLEPQMTTEWIARACDRHFGVGADGMILLQTGKDGADFFMRYYNSDGRTSTFCGNGGRCIVAYAGQLKVHAGSCRFLGTDGWHDGQVLAEGTIALSMADVHHINTIDENTFILQTGSPHFVTFLQDINELDVRAAGREVRYGPAFAKEGINVNFAQRIGPAEIAVRTYERGVEDETLACGTGVVATALAAAYASPDPQHSWLIHARGGDLQVEFQREGPQVFNQVKLIGPAVESFRGEIILSV